MDGCWEVYYSGKAFTDDDNAAVRSLILNWWRRISLKGFAKGPIPVCQWLKGPYNVWGQMDKTFQVWYKKHLFYMASMNFIGDIRLICFVSFVSRINLKKLAFKNVPIKSKTQISRDNAFTFTRSVTIAKCLRTSLQANREQMYWEKHSLYDACIYSKRCILCWRGLNVKTRNRLFLFKQKLQMQRLICYISNTIYHMW